MENYDWFDNQVMWEKHQQEKYQDDETLKQWIIEEIDWNKNELKFRYFVLFWNDQIAEKWLRKEHEKYKMNFSIELIVFFHIEFSFLFQTVETGNVERLH